MFYTHSLAPPVEFLQGAAPRRREEGITGYGFKRSPATSSRKEHAGRELHQAWKYTETEPIKFNQCYFYSKGPDLAVYAFVTPHLHHLCQICCYVFQCNKNRTYDRCHPGCYDVRDETLTSVQSNLATGYIAAAWLVHGSLAAGVNTRRVHRASSAGYMHIVFF